MTGCGGGPRGNNIISRPDLPIAKPPPQSLSNFTQESKHYLSSCYEETWLSLDPELQFANSIHSKTTIHSKTNAYTQESHIAPFPGRHVPTHSLHSDNHANTGPDFLLFDQPNPYKNKNKKGNTKISREDPPVTPQPAPTFHYHSKTSHTYSKSHKGEDTKNSHIYFLLKKRRGEGRSLR